MTGSGKLRTKFETDGKSRLTKNQQHDLYVTNLVDL